ncbi:YqeB family protein [Arthrobacter russicus]|jgi:hypothetical protein|uniref:YqeB PH domain-containing protein n=1 Tax=Arthrobacter russicus TaxID=172040 RepID=A0ABU1JFM0_9MICC|nr:hypothetical protein [Arthrobacter russicus]MDR6270914.1 hypothetical protein [Arthrobacter russicus]
MTETRLEVSRNGKALLLLATVVGGVSLGVALPVFSRWIATWQWAPAQSVFRFIGSTDQWWIIVGLPLLGLLAGLGFARYVLHRTPALLISDQEVRITQDGQSWAIPRSKVTGVRREKRKTVIEASGDGESFEGAVVGSPEEIRDAFLRHGYPWASE